MNKLQITPLAKNDLQEIKAYITDELQNPTAALDIIKRITKRLRSLVDFPIMGAALSSIVDIDTDYRYLVYGNYKAFYRYEDETVYVIRVLYSRRDFMKILFGDTSNEDEE